MLMLGIGVMLSSCGEKKSAIKGYEWLEGTWEVNEGYFYVEIEITKNEFTVKSDDDRFLVNNKPIDICNTHNYYCEYNEGNILALNEDYLFIAIDEENESLVLLESEFGAYTMKKTAEPKVPIEVKETKTEKKKYKSSSNKSKKLIDAFNKSEYIMFETSYVDGDLSQRPYYIVLHPFVYSEDATHGIIYYVCYGEDKWNSYRKGEVTAILNYYGEYEVFGNYVRVRDIVQVNNEKRVEPLIYTFNDINGGLNLYGGFPRHRTEKQYYRQITNTPNLIIELLEKENVCRHR